MIQFFPSNCATSVEELSFTNTAISVFPNPNNDTFSVVMNSEFNNSSRFYISNSVGQRIIEETIKLSSGFNTYKFELRNLQSGVYFITFVVDGKIRTHKLIIE